MPITCIAHAILRGIQIFPQAFANREIHTNYVSPMMNVVIQIPYKRCSQFSMYHLHLNFFLSVQVAFLKTSDSVNF